MKHIIIATLSLACLLNCSESQVEPIKAEKPKPQAQVQKIVKESAPKVTSAKDMASIKSNVIHKVITESKLATGIDLNDEPIKPLEAPKDLDSNKVKLGDLLFHDNRLSKDNTLSCASCHDLGTGGTDVVAVSTGIGGVKGPINSPTVFNSSLSLAQFWDGRAKDLVEQAAGPVHNPKEMGSNWAEVLGKLKGDAQYEVLFKASYSDGITGANIANAIAEFEKALITTNSPFDQYLKGNAAAIGDLEKEGYRLFKGYGCVTCHNGPAVGGNSYQKFGLVKDYFADKKVVTEVDYGRYNVTKKDEDKHKFKVPSLRVAALTAPYFHDASAQSLEDAVKVMGHYQLGHEFSQDELKAIVAFLKSLVGDYGGVNLLNKK